MSDDKKYYYLKFKENYFEQDHIKVIESMKNGHTYSLILIKLYLKSLKFDGQLRINERIPYMRDKIELLAGVLNHDPDHVMQAINLANSLGVIDIFESGEMFMVDIQNFIGTSSTEADRKREYRNKLAEKNKMIPERTNVGQMSQKSGQMSQEMGQMSGQMSGRSSPEIELEIDIEKDIEKDIEREKKKNFSPPSPEEVETYCKEKEININIETFIDYYKSKGWMVGRTKMKDWKAAVRNWARRDNEFNKNSAKEKDLSDYIDKIFEDDG